MTVAAKISRPQLPAVHPRTRIFARLNEASGRSVTWLAGPAGAGKTTAIASYLESAAQPVVWYELDAGDADTATLFHYLTAHALGHGDAAGLPRFAPLHRAGLAVFARRFFEAFFHICFPTPPAGALVFDNVHEVAEDAVLFAILREAIEVLPAGVRMFFVSRAPPPADFARALANGRIARLGWDDLRFSEAETQALIDLRAGAGPKPDATTLHRMTDGWAAGMILWLETEGMRRPESPMGDEARETIFGYFAAEVVDRVDPPVVQVLLATACMSFVTETAAQIVTGRSDAGAILAQLNRQNLFTSKRHSDPPAYSYHPLFREFLLTQARARLGADELAAIESKAAAALADAGAEAEAMAILRRYGDAATAALLIKRHAPRLLRSGQIQTLAGWLDWLPGAFVAADPWLMFWQAATSMYRNPAATPPLWRKAFLAFRAAGDVHGLFRAWAGGIRSIVFLLNDFKPLQLWLRDLEEIEAAGICPPSAESEAEVASSGLMATLQLAGHGVIERWERRAARLFDGALAPGDRVTLGSALIFARAYLCDFAGAEHVLHALRLETASADPTLTLQRINGEAFLLSHEHKSAAHSFAIIDEGLRLANDTGIFVYRHLLVSLGILAAACAGDEAAGRKYLALFDVRALGGNAASFATWARGHFHLEFEGADAATPWIERSYDLVQGCGCPEGEVMALAARAVCCLEKGALDACDAHLRAAEAVMAVNTNSGRARLTVMLDRAAWQLACGDRAGAALQLRTAFAFGRKMDLPSCGLITRKRLAELCATALDQGIEVDFVRRLIEARRLTAPPWHPVSADWPFSLQLFTLGQAVIVVRGRPFVVRGKAPKMPLRLLRAILAYGPEAAPVDDVCQILWPDADGDVARRTLDTTLHRLRKLLPDEGSILTTSAGLQFDRDLVWVDAWQVEALTGFIGQQLDRGATPDSVDLRRATQQLLRLYRGPFLADEDYPRVVTARGRLASTFVRAIANLGGAFESMGRADEALALYQAALVADETSELLYQRAIVCHGLLGQRGEATRLWQSCRRALEHHFGIEPSLVTRKAYERAG